MSDRSSIADSSGRLKTVGDLTNTMTPVQRTNTLRTDCVLRVGGYQEP